MIIPEKILVGFNKRSYSDTYIDVDDYYDGLTYLLGFATFKDKGKIRKELSWNNWRDRSIDPQELNNVPREGFKFAEFNKRSGGWFSSGRTMFRISDPYGFDLEITPGNLMAIICSADIKDGVFQGEFIWAWEGKDLNLLAVNSEKYEEAIMSTKKQSMQTIKPATLENGDLIELKNEEKYIYIGKVWCLEHYFDCVKPVRLHIVKYTDSDSYVSYKSLSVINVIQKNVKCLPVDELIEILNSDYLIGGTIKKYPKIVTIGIYGVISLNKLTYKDIKYVQDVQDGTNNTCAKYQHKKVKHMFLVNKEKTKLSDGKSVYENIKTVIDDKKCSIEFSYTRVPYYITRPHIDDFPNVEWYYPIVEINGNSYKPI